MKRLILSLAAIAAVAGPIAASATAAQAQSWDRRENHADRRGDNWDRRDNRRDDRYDRRDTRYDDRRHYQPPRPPPHYQPPRPPPQASWDHRRYNGYYYQNRWFYGPPPVVYYSHPQYRPGYVAWRRGAVLPHHYRGYVIHDYHRYRLRPPPRGYAWHQVGNDYLLTAIATGIIFEIISNR
ncbi:MAG: RcnB family protein [Phenylobacterium sp.]|uniref:RcnB family protein n=1 Tax=Phenylobacterium sp. TaxID=1871053 RepID=UPI00272552CE|nr:RcnB family protein [Phenylobacterium sp.]MDO8900099.1 RcnB family protein [Phenylobacterium sp.]MDP2213613.1 RcnB family protein [Phenylobacterium sp.]